MTVRRKQLPLALVAVLTSCSSPAEKVDSKSPGSASAGDQPVEESCVCTLSKEELAEREKWLASFSPGVEAVSGLADGFEVRFTGTAQWTKKLFELVEKERSCCSSVVFELRFEPDTGPILLRCRGPREATDFLRTRLAPAVMPGKGK